MALLDLSALEKAAASLRRGIDRSLAAPEDEELRDAVIQRFEYTMDLSWKLIQRYLRLAGVPESEFRTKRDLFREAAKMDLVSDPVGWFAYHEARNSTSHIYHAEVAQAVYSKALEFMPDVSDLLNNLKKGMEDD